MAEFLIGTGIALLLAIIAWSDQIRNLHKDTVEAEKYLFENRKLNWKYIRLLIRKKGTPEEILDAINIILKDKSDSEIKDIRLIYTFNELDNKRKRLERLYNKKYYLVFILTFLFFSSGIAELFIKSCNKIWILGLEIASELVPVFICILFSFAILIFVILLNRDEARYRDEFVKTMDEI